MRTLTFTAQKGGINRLRIRGGAKADSLYDLVNGYVTDARTAVQRDGTVRDAVVPATTRGLTAFAGLLHVFSHQLELYTPVGYLANVLSHPTDSDATIAQIHYAQPFMGALYVVAEWSDGAVFHYWLSYSGEWVANTVYRDGDVVIPTTPNGLLYKATPNNPLAPTQAWRPLTNYNVGDTVLPSTYNGYYFEVTDTQGDVPISGPVEPDWNANEGAITVESADGSGAPASSAADSGAPQPPPDVQDRYGTDALSASSAAAVAASDTIPLWTPGTLYNPGDLVKPRSVAPVVNSDIPNAGFEAGDMNWVKGVGWEITNVDHGNQSDGQPYQGVYYARHTGATGGLLQMATTVPVVAGQFLSASCYEAKNGDGGPAQSLQLRWYDDSDTLIKTTYSDISTTDKHKSYRIFTAQDVTPGGATKVNVAFEVGNTGNAGSIVSVDSFTWDYVNLSPSEADFTVYQAVQSSAGVSGSTEPVWPGAGNTVVDNEVTWLGGVTSVITWTARPIMKSGSTEPIWGEQPGSSASDNTISWVATTGLVEQAPHSKIVTQAAKKIFAGDNDIVAYSATVNPLDWTTPKDAGYLPTGLNTYGANPVRVLGLYRGNLLPFNSGGFQMWQVDEDPELMQIIDAIPVGSTYHRSYQSVKNDGLFLTQLGYRSVGIAAASSNLQTNDIGSPIDVLVMAKLRAGVYEAKSIYYPARGQYWGWFGPEVFVCTFNDKAPSWSRYVFPEALTDATLLDNDLFLRTANHKVWKVDPDALKDDMSAASASDGIAYDGTLWWPALDLGNMGVDKQLDCFDLVCKGRVAVSFGYDQRDPTVLTDEYVVDGDTLPGTAIPFPLTAPSFAPKLVFEGGQEWEWLAMNLYVQDSRSSGFAG